MSKNTDFFLFVWALDNNKVGIQFCKNISTSSSWNTAIFIFILSIRIECVYEVRIVSILNRFFFHSVDVYRKLFVQIVLEQNIFRHLELRCVWTKRVQTKLYSRRLPCSIVSLTAANTNRIFSVSVAHVKWEYMIFSWSSWFTTFSSTNIFKMNSRAWRWSHRGPKGKERKFVWEQV